MTGSVDLFQRVPQIGRLEWIGLARAHRAEIETPACVELREGSGLEADHHGADGGDRQVTLLQFEHLPVIARLCGRQEVSPELCRRNLVVSGINLASLRDRRFRIGRALLVGSGDCPPCSRMEENLGMGGYQAMRGHGGITARVLRAGLIEVGDEIVIDDPGVE